MRKKLCFQCLQRHLRQAGEVSPFSCRRDSELPDLSAEPFPSQVAARDAQNCHWWGALLSLLGGQQLITLLPQLLPKAHVCFKIVDKSKVILDNCAGNLGCNSASSYNQHQKLDTVLALGLMEKSISTSPLPASEAHSGDFLGSGIEFRHEMFQYRKSPVL